MRNLIIFIGVAFGLVAGVAMAAQPQRRVEYFEGTIKTSSLDGSTQYAPRVSALVYRVVDPVHGRVLEIVHRDGRAFVAVMKRKGKSLDFTAQDTESTFSGTLTYEDESLSSWSYDINVSEPVEGKLSGSLPADGASIDSATGILRIRKIWDDHVLISEKYNPISETEYEEKLAGLVP